MHSKQKERSGGGFQYRGTSGGGSRLAAQPARQPAGQLRPDGPMAGRRPADQPRETLRDAKGAVEAQGGGEAAEAKEHKSSSFWG